MPRRPQNKSASLVKYDPITRYRERGNIRPSSNWLETSIPQLEESDEPMALLVMADMCLDLAMQEPDSRVPRHINRARGYLDELIEQATTLIAAGFNQGAQWRPFGVQAALRRSELENWGNAAIGKPIRHDYGTLLQAATIFDPTEPDNKSRATLIEFMPVLLGARAIETNGAQGWLARLALAREEAKVTLENRVNPNWDTGILLAPSSDEFSSPSIRVNLKSSSGNGSKQYVRGGVIPLNARSHGIAFPAQVIYSCLQELDGPVAAGTLPFPILNTDQLNAVTADIYDTTHKQS
jgi:hypothetical protein